MAVVQPSIATAEHVLYDEDVDHATRFGQAEGEERVHMCVQNYGLKDMCCNMCAEHTYTYTFHNGKHKPNNITGVRRASYSLVSAQWPAIHSEAPVQHAQQCRSSA